MKHSLLLLLLLLVALPTLAQRGTSPGGGTTSPVIVDPTRPGFGDLPPTGYNCTEAVSRQQRTADSLLLPLDKSRIPTHILYDRVAPQARLTGLQPNRPASYQVIKI